MTQPTSSEDKVKPAPSPAAQAVAKPVALKAQPIGPGEIEQLMHQFPKGTMLAGLTLTEGLEVVTIMVGHVRFPDVSKADQTWLSVCGTVTPEGAYVIVLARNTTKKILVAKGTWWVDGQPPPPEEIGYMPPQAKVSPPSDPSQSPITTTARSPLDPPSAEPPQGMSPAYAAKNSVPHVAAAAGAPHLPPGAVMPGANEVCVLLSRQDVKRLLEAVKGVGLDIQISERPNLERRLEQALK